MREGLELASLRMIEIKSHLRSYRHIAILHLDGGKTHLALQEGMRDSGVEAHGLRIQAGYAIDRGTP